MSDRTAPEGVRVFGPYQMYGVGCGGLWRFSDADGWRLARGFIPKQLERIRKACESNTADWAQYLLFNLDSGKTVERDSFAEGFAWDMLREFEARGTDNRVHGERRSRKRR